MKGINGNVHRLRMQAAIVLTALLLALGTTPAPQRTAWASVLAQDPDPRPIIADGVWEGVMVSDSRFSAPGAGGGANFRGEMRFTSSGGILDGSWNLIGTGTVSSDFGVGTAEYTSAGEVIGTSSALQFASTSTRIDMTIVQPDGVTVELSVPMPPGESGIIPVLTHATCSQVVGTWRVEAEGLVGGGSFVITRVSDLREEDASDYLAQVTDLLVDAHAFTAAVEASGGSAEMTAGLIDLVERAENLYDAIDRSTDCGLSEEDEGYLNLLGDVAEHLLEFALANPDAFSDLELLDLVNLAVRTGMTIRGSWDGLRDDLSAELADRLEAAVEAGDVFGIDIVAAAGTLIADWDLVAEAEAAARDME